MDHSRYLNEIYIKLSKDAVCTVYAEILADRV